MNTNLYFIKDRFAKVPVTKVIQVENDLVACNGFKEFLKKENINAKQFALYKIAELNIDNGVNLSYKDPLLLCIGGDCEDKLNELIAKFESEQE